MLDIDQIIQELTDNFPEYKFFKTQRLTGRCIVAKKSKYYGADIFVKGNEIIVEAAIPDWTTRLVLGAGAAYKKITDRKYAEVATQIQNYLGHKYEVILRQ